MSDAVADEHEALIQFLYLAPVGLAQIAADGEIAMLNPLSAQLLMPLSTDGSLSNLFVALANVAPDLRPLAAAFEAPYGTVCEGRHIRLRAGGDERREPQILSLTLLKLDAGRLMAVLTDITQQVKRERALKHSQACFDAMLTGVSDYALVGLDARGRVEAWNPSIGRVTGFERAAVEGAPYSIFDPEDATTPDRVLDRLREADADGWSLDDGWRRRADGTRFWGSALIAPLQDRSFENALLGGPVPAPPDRALGLAVSAGKEVPRTGHGAERAYCLVIRDITDKRELNEAQRRAVACDHLTGIANRRAFFDAAELEIERWRRAPRPLSLIMVDADHFKRINDGHGHPAGDAVLRDLAACLAETFREVDVVARVGGEEFAVLLPSTGLQRAAAVAERFRRAVEGRDILVDGARIRCTVSAGVAAMDDGLAGLDALIKRADHALYAAKAAGRNRVECWSRDGSAAALAA